MPEENKDLEIVKERQKTLRLFMFLAFFAIIAVIGIFVVFKGSEEGGQRKVDLNLKEGKISLSVDKPIVEQVDQPKAAYNAPGGTVNYTTGAVDRSVINELAGTDPAAIQPDRFTGENFINKEAGFLLTVQNPQAWNVAYNPNGMYDPITPVNTIMDQDGSHLNVNIENTQMAMSVQDYVAAALQTLMVNGLILDMPQVSYDNATQTAFLFFENQMTGGQSYMKVITRGTTAYLATANYNPFISDPARIDDLTKMVATFTLIGG